MVKKNRIATALLALLMSFQSYAVVELNEFSSEQIRVRYQMLIEELRCPKCQNQNLAESDSAVSIDLRREVLFMLEEGSTDTEIRAFLRERYGDFILYNPPFEGKTLLVWIIPFVLLLSGVFVVVSVLKSAMRNAESNQMDSADRDIEDS